MSNQTKNKNITIVSGAPCAGKNTYIKNNRSKGDIVWDFDAIHSALTEENSHQHIEKVRKYIFSMRNQFYKDLKTEKELRVWIINSSPLKSVRENLAFDLDAEIIYIKRSQEDCLTVADDERPIEWKSYINSYFEKFEELEQDENIKIVEVKNLESRKKSNTNKMSEKEKKDVWNPKHTSETRYFNIESRLGKDGDQDVVIGHAAIFNSLSEDLGGFKEKIQPGAFDDVMGNDVRAYLNHNPDFLLGRTTAGTLRLSIDEQGLKYELDIPETTAGRDLKENLRLGNITQSSFAFTIGPEGDVWERGEDGMDIRIITKIKRLYDVSPVALPAYASADDLALAKRSNFLDKEKTRKQNENQYEKNSVHNLKINLLKRKK